MYQKCKDHPGGPSWQCRACDVKNKRAAALYRAIARGIRRGWPADLLDRIRARLWVLQTET